MSDGLPEQPKDPGIDAPNRERLEFTERMVTYWRLHSEYYQRRASELEAQLFALAAQRQTT